MRLFQKKITPHCLRHSSATYYAKEYNGNVPMLAQRFGWSFDASELKTYVRLSGTYNIEGAKVSYRNQVSKLIEENQQLKAEFEKLKAMVNSSLLAEIQRNKGQS